MGLGKQIDAPCGCDETVGFDHNARTVHCRRCGDWWTFAGDRVRSSDMRAGVRAASVIGEAMLADAVRTSARAPTLPTDSAERKRTPLCTGLLDYFPAALAKLVDHIAGVGCIPEPADDLMAALRDRNWGEVCTLALCDLDAELGGGGQLDNVLSFSDLFTEYSAALAAVAQVSWHGNEKHNPGQPLHHARGKSMDHEDCIARHHVEAGGFDGPMRHSACKLWRALAAWQEQLEKCGAPKARGAR